MGYSNNISYKHLVEILDYSKQNRIQDSTIATTGNAHDEENNYDVRCNIYDMAGSVREWSTETCHRCYRLCTSALRGGRYADIYNTGIV